MITGRGQIVDCLGFVSRMPGSDGFKFKDYFVILPSMRLWDVDEFMKAFNGQRCADGFSYNSGTNTEWLSVDQIRTLIREHVDPDFSV